MWTYKWYLVSVCIKIHASCNKFEVVSWIYEAWCLAKVTTDWLSKKILFIFFLYIHVCACVMMMMIFLHHHCITKKIKFCFVSIIDEGVWWGQNCNKYCGDETCYIIIYYEISCNINILCSNKISVRLQ